MTDQTLTHVYVLLDRSGSMQSMKDDVEGGFAAFVEEQRAGAGRCRITLAQFDNEYEVVYADVDIAEAPDLRLEPRGGTALLDSLGRLVTDAGRSLAAQPEGRRPGTVIVAVMTDGMEKASREWTHPAIRALVEQQTTQYGWQFLYMGADQDAIEVGASIGVDRDHAITYARGKSREAMRTQSGKIASQRAARMVDAAAPMAGFTEQERRDLAE